MDKEVPSAAILESWKFGDYQEIPNIYILELKTLQDGMCFIDDYIMI